MHILEANKRWQLILNNCRMLKQVTSRETFNHQWRQQHVPPLQDIRCTNSNPWRCCWLLKHYWNILRPQDCLVLYFTCFLPQEPQMFLSLKQLLILTKTRHRRGTWRRRWAPERFAGGCSVLYFCVRMFCRWGVSKISDDLYVVQHTKVNNELCFQAANATRRSAVLHQRALLLKQLSELDKLVSMLTEYLLDESHCCFLRGDECEWRGERERVSLEGFY